MGHGSDFTLAYILSTNDLVWNIMFLHCTLTAPRRNIGDTLSSLRRIGLGWWCQAQPLPFYPSSARLETHIVGNGRGSYTLGVKRFRPTETCLTVGTHQFPSYVCLSLTLAPLCDEGKKSLPTFYICTSLSQVLSQPANRNLTARIPTVDPRQVGPVSGGVAPASFVVTVSNNARYASLFQQVFFDIDAGGEDMGRITLELRADVVPKTAGEGFLAQVGRMTEADTAVGLGRRRCTITFVGTAGRLERS